MSIIKLKCLILGQTKAFTVAASTTDDIERLKDFAKQKSSPNLDHIQHIDLILWKLNPPINLRSPDFDEKIKAINLQLSYEFNGDERLQLLDDLDDVADHWEDSPQSRHLHIIVQKPKPVEVSSDMLKLNCFIIERPENIDPGLAVNISKSSNISDLKVLIKEWKSLVDIRYDDLEIRKSSFPIDDLGIKEPKALGPALGPFKLLSELFPADPDAKQLHILVCIRKDGLQPTDPNAFVFATGKDEVTKLRKRFCINRKSDAPSSGADPKNFRFHQSTQDGTIYCNRPEDPCRTLSLSLLHPVFGQFMDDFRNATPSSDDQTLAVDLVNAMTDIYKKELDRQKAITKAFETSGYHMTGTRIDNYTTDADISFKGFRYLIAELKNEVGSSGAEPYMQGSLYYLESTRTEAAKHSSSPLPCLLMVVFGPYIAFAGAIWTDRPNVQMLTPAIPSHYHSDNVTIRGMFIRQVVAFRRAMATLESYYEKLTSGSLPSSTSNPTHPYMTSYTPAGSSGPVLFEYTECLPGRLVFFGHSDKDGLLCIKFTRHYSKEVHEFCAKEGFAPRLHAIEYLPDGWQMVVMEDVRADYVNLKTFLLSNVDPSQRDSLLGNIRRSLVKLHQAGFVHGDIRDVNILVEESGLDGTFLLVDFEMGGEIGKAVYPPLMNTTSVTRPGGVWENELVLAEHDMAMVDFFT